MSEALQCREQLAGEYRAWLDANPPAVVGYEAWEAKWSLYRQVKEEIALLTGGPRRCSCGRDDGPLQAKISRVLRSVATCTKCGLPLGAA